MELRALGRTGVQVSKLCLGCMTFGGKTPAEDAYRIVDRAIEIGINFVDTANHYNAGASEVVIGEALRRTGKRARVVLATKVRGPMGPEPNMRGTSRRHIIEQCEASLRRLNTDFIDLYQIHRPEPSIPIDETLRALDDLVRAGKIRYVGTSTFAAWQLVESLWVSKELGLNRFVCEQPAYNLLDRRIERELVPMARTYGFALIPWSPLGGGLLTGKYARGAPLPAGARIDDASNALYAKRLNDRTFDALEAFAALAGARGCSPSQLALAWIMQQPGVTSPIIGPRTIEQLEDNLAALAVTITDDDRETIDRIVGPGDCVAPFYEADFGPHLHRV